MSEFAETIVVGAGPAGATAARRLAEAGRDVLLVEARPLPRQKSCAGGIPRRTIQALGLDLTPVQPSPVSGVVMLGGSRHLIDFADEDEPAAIVVDRAVFDHHLTRLALQAGARLRENCRVLSASRTTAGFELRIPDGALSCNALVIADGVFSQVGKSLGFDPNPRGFCLEATVPMRDDLDTASRQRFLFHLTILRDGYAWAFPRHDVWTVGIGSLHAQDTGLRPLLERFVRETPELAGGELLDFRGGMLSDFPGPRAYYAHRGAYIAGDAAGLVDPLTGEGIHYAIQSGRLAAEAILTGGEQEYETALQRDVLAELIAARRHARRFRACPAWLRRLGMCLPLFGKTARKYAEITVGRRSYVSFSST